MATTMLAALLATQWRSHRYQFVFTCLFSEWTKITVQTATMLCKPLSVEQEASQRRLDQVPLPSHSSNNDCLSRYPEETMLLSSRTW